MMSSPTPQPAKPRPRDAANARQIILDASEAVFARDGFSGARVDEIARIAGYNKSLLFQYFGDKKNLYFAVIRRVRERSDAAFLSAMNVSHQATQPLTRERLKTLLAASVAWVFDHFLEHPRYLKIFMWEMATEWQTFRQTSEPLEPSFQIGLELFSHAQQLGLLREDIAPETVIANIMSLPLIALAAIPRFETLRERANPNQAVTIAALREQTVHFVLHAALPD